MVGDGICHLITCQNRRKRHISAGQCLSDTHNIRFYSGVFPGEKFACPSESCCYFIEDEKKSVFPAELFRFTQVLRMIKPHTACSLNNGFEDERRQFFRMFFNRLPQRDNIFRIPLPVKPGNRSRNKMADRKRRAEKTVHSRHRVADGHGIPGISVITGTDSHEIILIGFSCCVPVLYSHFQGNFNSYRTGVCIEYLLHGRRN